MYSDNTNFKNKYKELAINSKKFDWIEYFKIEEKYLNDKIERREFIKRINLIKNKTKDLNLINLLNKHIKT